MDRDELVVQMAKVFGGERVIDPQAPGEEVQRRAEEALTRVELYLGMDVDQARELITRVLQDVS
jgi:hypothetical protein